ncbi:hypothetical protein [Cellulomonas soli]|uniref:hypothetical protein n=1 Tax=Cellulomonas soli TaxID=931535 RepID=UPI0015CA7BCC|nr:hypothetical protein [Cellulomonas soli]NYI57337.1 hypothetical protein [Cellulomonas soli]
MAAGAAAVLVLRWAGIAPRTCLIAGACAFVLVPVAAWIASTVPGPPPGSSRERDDRRR